MFLVLLFLTFIDVYWCLMFGRHPSFIGQFYGLGNKSIVWDDTSVLKDITMVRFASLLQQEDCQDLEQMQTYMCRNMQAYLNLWGHIRDKHFLNTLCPVSLSVLEQALRWKRTAA